MKIRTLGVCGCVVVSLLLVAGCDVGQRFTGATTKSSMEGTTNGARPTAATKPARKPKELSVAMVYRPTKTLTGAHSLMKGKVYVAVGDGRARKDAIGQNIEKSTPVMVKTADDAAGFVRNAVAGQLADWGATVVDNAAESDRQLLLTLTNFWTEESSVYRTNVSAQVKITNRYGKTIWEGVTTGSATNFGRSLNEVNYQEAFSNATNQMAWNVLTDSSVAAALSGK